jgi:hypothetical protein
LARPVAPSPPKNGSNEVDAADKGSVYGKNVGIDGFAALVALYYGPRQILRLS